MATALGGQRVLLAYGLLGEGMVRLGLDYMAGQLRWLQASGAEASVVALPTTARIADNAGRIAAALQADERPALLVAHSKGGLEALAALLDPGVARHCRGLLTLQSPFYGSPVADAVLARPWLQRGLARLVRLAGLGAGEGLDDLSTAARHRWMQENAAAVAALTAHLPVLSIASAVGEEAVGPDRRYLALARWMAGEGQGPNDGLVSVASALLPGARHRVVRAGHRGLVSAGRGRDPIGVLESGLTALLSPASLPEVLPGPLPA
ncbi:hypothetical protein [Roseomonas sp. USHLN139]|uniref:hypothetical protein n=1 Tax=Roseomonas sp. USHLN139 TaxID=3081298 RepID=UPI003B019F53